MKKEPVYKFICWICGVSRGLTKYHAPGGPLHICQKCNKEKA